MDLIKNKEYEKLILHLSEEDYRAVTLLDLLLSEGNRIIGEPDKDNKNSPLVEKHYYLVEDLCGKNNDQISKLEAEKKQLETKNQKLEQQLANSNLSETEKKLKEQELANSKKLLQEKEQELAKLRKQQPNNPTNTGNNKDNSKVNLAIGLGIVAAVIGLLCFILLLRKKNKH
ncbi:9087_t:CDS:2 [Entrophospora sp. SA101]|nr:9087_t:CDS:2 [Entrophospora sp. SA101]